MSQYAEQGGSDYQKGTSGFAVMRRGDPGRTFEISRQRSSFAIVEHLHCTINVMICQA